MGSKPSSSLILQPSSPGAVGNRTAPGLVAAVSARELDEALLLATARQGDQDAFRNLTEPYRRELLVFSYRLLGSLQDAEDLSQETLARAWAKLASFAGRSSFRAWLYKIATNTGLNMLAHASRRPPLMNLIAPAQENVSGEPVWFEPLLDSQIADLSTAPDAVYSLRESVSLAFMIALQGLPPHQRVTLILRDVLDWRATEVAEFLDLSVPAVNSALQRARATLAKRYHPLGLEAIKAPALTPPLQALLDRYMRAWETSDLETLLTLLREDATFSMPPQPQWYSGQDDIGRFFQTGVFTQGVGAWRLVPTFANAQPAYALYRFNPSVSAHTYFGLLILTLDDGVIASSIAFVDPALGARYGLPGELPLTEWRAEP
jgi:RNA polymerase sigma-70 factor, ECF subfamily